VNSHTPDSFTLASEKEARPASHGFWQFPRSPVPVGLLARNERDSFFDSPSTDKLNSTNRLNLTADVLMGSGAAILIATAALHLFPAHRFPRVPTWR
jgi:hypothetical protein